MKLESRIRHESGSTHRIMPPEQTIARVRSFMPRIGVTRIADNTGLDTIGMSVYSAIRPTDVGPNEGISVYNGKGLTRADSRAGAMMEAIERYCGEQVPAKVYTGSYAEITGRFPSARVLHPASMSLLARKPFTPDTELEWTDAWELLDDTPALVPLNFVLLPYNGPTEALWVQSTNGLASGNCLEEALCHALAEQIERDAYSMAVIRCEVVPKFHDLVNRLSSGHEAPATDRDAQADEAFPGIDIGTLPPRVRSLVRRAERAGVAVHLRDMTTDIGITALFCMMESGGPEAPFLAGGFGCDPNAEIAAIRAITEAAQGRNVAIQGVREDTTSVPQSKPVMRTSWWKPNQRTFLPFSSIHTVRNDDILDDVDLMLGCVRKTGFDAVYAIDLTDSLIPAHVVRVIVPGMESWFLHHFDADHCVLGGRAQRYLTPNA